MLETFIMLEFKTLCFFGITFCEVSAGHTSYASNAVLRYQKYFHTTFILTAVAMA